MTEETPWQRFKKKYDTKPWDLIDPRKPKVSKDIAEQRMSICDQCPYLIQLTRMCSKCGCYMPAKTTLAEAECPEQRWSKESVETDG